MNATTYNNRLKVAGLLKKDGTFKSGYDNDIAEIAYQAKNQRGEIKLLGLKLWRGSRRHLRMDDIHYRRTIEILISLKLKYQTGNDAPRGGAEGDFIILPRIEFNKIKNVL